MAQTKDIFVINLDRRKDRLALVSKRLKDLGLKWQRIAAIDGTSADFADKVDWAKHRAYNQYLQPRPAPIACYFSHRLAWQRMVDEGIAQAMILEDDVIPTQAWHKDILDIDLAAHGLESLRLDASRLLGAMPMTKYFDIPLGRWRAKNLNSWGGGAYILTRQGAMKCLRQKKMWFMADDFFTMNRVLGLKTALAVPHMWQHTEETASDVEPPAGYYDGRSSFVKLIASLQTFFNREFERLRYFMGKQRREESRA